MSWVRYDDGFAHHEKVMEVLTTEPAALALHLLGNCWTATSSTPGWIPLHVPARLVPEHGDGWAKVLGACRLWEEGELAGRLGWWVHDYGDYNFTADGLAAFHEKKQRAGRLGGLAKASNALAAAKQNGSKGLAVPVPVPVPKELKSGARENRKARAHTSPVPEAFAVGPELRAWARDNKITCDLVVETGAWQDYHKSRATWLTDWTASWRNWMRRTLQYGTTKAKPEPFHGGW